MIEQRGNSEMKRAIRLGIVGCAQGGHGRIWADLLSRPEGAKFGMTPARVWDADPQAAAATAAAVGATRVSEPWEAGEQVEGILITELFPSRYLELSRPFLEAGKRVFFNRPFAGSMEQATEIVRLARRHHAKIYSASALFHTAAAKRAQRQLADLVPLALFTVTGPTDHVAFYLPHAIACLTSVLGTGISRVQAVSLDRTSEHPRLASAPVVVYVEYGADAAVGPARGVMQMMGPGASWYGFRLKMFGAEREGKEIRFEVSYDSLLRHMARFFRTGVEPVPHRVLLEKTAVFYAALRSAEQGGCPVEVSEMIAASGRMADAPASPKGIGA